MAQVKAADEINIRPDVSVYANYTGTVLENLNYSVRRLWVIQGDNYQC